MTDKSTLIALADKLEKATAPSRELDALIACACNIRPDWLRGDTRKLVATGRGHVSAGKHGPGFDAPAYTASIDAALTLRPDGWLLTGLSDGILDPKYRDVRSLTKWLTGMARLGAVVNGPQDAGGMVSSMGANPAISVAAAALRAHAA